MFSASHWYLATELHERQPVPRMQGGAVDLERARRRLERWRGQEPFRQNEHWERRLASAGLTEEALLHLLGEPAEALRARLAAPLPWLRRIEQAYSAPTAEPFIWPAPVDRPPISPLLAWIEPLVHAASARLHERIQELTRAFPSAPFEAASASRALLGHLSDILTSLISRVLVVELHAAQLEQRLSGDTPEERFQDFVRHLRARDFALELLARYPVLARRVVEALEHWEDAGLEFLRHLAEDAGELWRRFAGGRAPGAMVEAVGGISDPHRRGRGVFLVRFASGLRLVYKPRPMAAEAAFQRLLTWLNAQGLTPPLRPLEILDAGDHGWVEHVEAAPCASPEEVRRFYQRQGSSIALLYLLEGTDFHHENLIASGEHPVLVDLETLFQPQVTARTLRELDRQPGAPLGGTVLKSGLLPHRIWSNRENPGVDLSGLGSRPGQLTPQAYLVSTERGTDRMRFERRQLEVEAASNHPRLGEQPVSLSDHAEDVAEGFSRMYHLLLERREALLAPEGPLAAFHEAPVRVIFRDTASYGTLKLESHHPHAMGDALERQRFFDHLWRAVVERPFLAALVPFELEELARGDIPLFTTRVGSRDLWTSSGQCLPGFFEDSGLERVRRRLGALSPVDHERQLWVLRRSIDPLHLDSAEGQRRSYAFQEAPAPARPEDLLSAARRMGERLLRLSFAGPEETHWLTLEHATPGGWRLWQAGPDLYLGLAGVALSLGYLGALTGDETFTRAARGALHSQAHLIEQDASRVPCLGILNGWGGVLYALTHLGVLWGERQYLDRAEAWLERLPPLVERDEELDLGIGSAGCILALLALAEHRPSELLWRTARACGDRLLARAQRQEHGVGWVVPVADHRALGGMSHGAAGICLALLRLAAATGDQRYRQTALAGLAFERSLFSTAERNWLDLRTDAPEAGGAHGGGERFMTAWCHGAPGIGLARLAGLSVLDDDEVRAEIRAAVATTLARGFGQNHSLCHGDLGNADFLLEAARVLGDGALRERIYRAAGGVLQSLEQHGPLYGLQSNIETPGLMVGIAGLAYGFARLAAPERLPSLLALSPPAATSAQRPPLPHLHGEPPSRGLAASGPLQPQSKQGATE